ncbi:MAG: leucine-rich repeat domain-containing protein, partial [Clostridia bacterium]|nr:leucine-rich repeat domain-containing protein [Clostridia bacterium]
MKKASFFLLLIFCSLLLAPAASAEVKETDGGIFYSVTDGAVTVEGFNAAGTVMRVPAEIDGLPVRYVAERACYGDAVLTEVHLPDTIVSIGEYAFSQCEDLKKVTIGGCGTIGFAAFRNSKQLRSVTLPLGLTAIEDEAFFGCARLGKTKIPASLLVIGVDAFAGCEQLYLDVSENAYAARYAEENRIPTSFTETFTFTVLIWILITVLLGGLLWLGYRFLRKRRPRA